MRESEILGTFQCLKAYKETRFGVMLTSDEIPGLSVLLPNNQVRPGTRAGDIYEVFLYKDSEDRLIATTDTPALTIGKTAIVRVKEVTNIGAFLDWGLAKDLLLPFKEQTTRLRTGDKVPVALYVDKTERLCATMKIYPYLTSDSDYVKGDHVTGIIYEITDSYGAFVVVDSQYTALIPHNEMTRDLHVLETVQARVKDVTADGKLTLSLQEKIKIQIDKDADMIYARLQQAGGYLPFHDKTSPEIIKREFKISKAAFKRALGHLRKKKKIDILPDGIRITDTQE